MPEPLDPQRIFAALELNDVIRSKETANRAKDRAALPHLYALEDELAARDDEA